MARGDERRPRPPRPVPLVDASLSHTTGAGGGRRGPATAAPRPPTPPSPSLPLSERDGRVARVLDDALRSSVIELDGANCATTSATCPADPRAELGVRLPVLSLLLKPLGRFLSFEVTLLDDRGVRRRLRASNFQPAPRVAPDVAALPLALSPGWNRVVLHLGDLTKAAYGTGFAEATRVTVHASCRVRAVYFSAAPVPDRDLPPEFRLFAPASAAVEGVGGGVAAAGEAAAA